MKFNHYVNFTAQYVKMRRAFRCNRGIPQSELKAQVKPDRVPPRLGGLSFGSKPFGERGPRMRSVFSICGPSADNARRRPEARWMAMTTVRHPLAGSGLHRSWLTFRWKPCRVQCAGDIAGRGAIFDARAGALNSSGPSPPLHFLPSSPSRSC
jgi:hypothetical protein